MSVSICGVPVDSFDDPPAALEAISRRVDDLQGGRPAQVNFINAHVVNTACRDPELRPVLSEADLNLPDGVGIWLGGVILHRISLNNLNGTDFGLNVLEWGAARGLRFYFLGAREGIAEMARQKLCARLPGLVVAGTHDGYLDAGTEALVLREIAEVRTDVLFVCMGVPGQELWINRNLHALQGVKVAFGLGAFFDFHAGAVRRAPAWMIKARIEWIFRLWQEPERLWKRYLIGNFTFIWHILRCGLAGRNGVKTVSRDMQGPEKTPAPQRLNGRS